MKTFLIRSVLSLFAAVALPIAAQTPAVNPPTFVKGDITIQYNTRTTTPIAHGTKDVYTINVNVCNSALFHGTVTDLPQLIEGWVSKGVTQNRVLTYDLQADLMNPKNPTQVRNVGRLFGTVPQLVPVAQQIEALTFQPIYTVYLQYPEQIRLPHAMLGFDRCFTQWIFDKGQIAGHQGLIAAVISAEGLHQKLDHEQLAKKVVQELREQLGIMEKPLWHQILAEKRATFSCEPNLSRPTHITPLTNVLLAGDYTAGEYPATLEGAVMSGIRCAEKINNSQISTSTPLHLNPAVLP